MEMILEIFGRVHRVMASRILYLTSSDSIRMAYMGPKVAHTIVIIYGACLLRGGAAFLDIL